MTTPSLEDLLGQHTKDTGLTIPFSEIPPIPATELWPGVIPNRTPVLLVAPGGTGKGLGIAAVTARVTTGIPFPGEVQGREPGQVILVAPEDDANEDMSFRLIAAGADRELVRDLTLLPDGSRFLLPRNEPELRRAISEANSSGPPVRLVTLDPLLALSENGLSSRKAVREVMYPLLEIAQDYGIAIILSHHTNKDGKTIAGSRELTDIARLVWLIERDREDDAMRTMKVWKSNRKTVESVRYRIEGDGPDVRAVFSSGEDTGPKSRAARLRLAESPVTPADMARKWLAENPEKGKHARTEVQEAQAS